MSFMREKCVMCGGCVQVCTRGAHVIGNSGHEIARDRCVSCGECVKVCPQQIPIFEQLAKIHERLT
jgi:MinD superfamily P-loop ATPase